MGSREEGDGLNRAEIEERFASISVWKRGHERAPHKPLLLLFALGHYGRGGERLIPYHEVDRKLRSLLVEFGPFRKSYHTEYPFWRLQRDRIWEVRAPEWLLAQYGRSDPKKSDLLKFGVKGGLVVPIYEAVASDPAFAMRLTSILLDANFPSTLHEDILSAVGLDMQPFPQSRRRDPTFRMRVLTAYEYKCAVCAFDLRLGNTQVGLEAAHIMWHQAGGPDTESNGLALCVLHHKLFDLGVFTLSEQLVVTLSDLAHGNQRFDEYILAFHGREIRMPQNPMAAPDQTFLNWHRRQVFKGRPRYLRTAIPNREGYVAEPRPKDGYGLNR